MTKQSVFLNIITRQEGITLLLGILVLSAILAISFSLATILFVEIRSSGDLLRTETSYYGAQAVTEEALFKFKRQVPSSICGTLLPNCYSPTVGAVDLKSVPPFENPISDPVQQDIIPAGGSFSNAKHYTIYNPACPAALGPSGQGGCITGGSGYSKIIVTYKDSNNTDRLHAYLCQFHPEYGVGFTNNNTYATAPCTDPSSPVPPSSDYWLAPKDAQTNSPSNSLSWVLDPNQQQELILYNLGTNGPIYVQIETFDDATTPNPKGIPYFEQTAVDINAQNAGVNRKIRVLIPNSSGGPSSPTVSGRYMRVQLAGTNPPGESFLGLAEVQVMDGSGANLAIGKPASQSSTYPVLSPAASSAVDGNTDGNYWDGSVSHTNLEQNAWWQVDLGALSTINSIKIWNRTDCCSFRLSDYWVFISDNPFGPSDTPGFLQNRAGTWYSHQTVMPNPSTTIAASSFANGSGSGPEAYWRLDDLAGPPFADSSGNGNSGSCSGTQCPLFTAAGKVIGAEKFDGANNKIIVPDSSLWALAGDFTISLWFNADDWNGDWWTRAFLGQDEGPGNTNKWIFSYDGSKTIFHINTTSGNGPVIGGNTWTPAPNTWYHIAVTRQGSTYAFYRDKSPDGTAVDSSVIPDVAAPLIIGWAEGSRFVNGTFVGGFKGIIDDVRIYDRALSPSEVLALP